jgi:hypothetical protein
MINLEDMPLSARLLIGGLAVVAALILLMLAAAEGETATAPPPLTGEYLERVLQLDREAIESAYVKHIEKLFDIWVTDYSEEPPKAVKGARQARSAYERAMRAIEHREQQLKKK